MPHVMAGEVLWRKCVETAVFAAGREKDVFLIVHSNSLVIFLYYFEEMEKKLVIL